MGIELYLAHFLSPDRNDPDLEALVKNRIEGLGLIVLPNAIRTVTTSWVSSRSVQNNEGVSRRDG